MKGGEVERLESVKKRKMIGERYGKGKKGRK